MKIYISGAITGTTDYMERFAEAEEYLKEKGYTVINPAKVNANLPEDTTWQQYMDMSMTMLSMCEAVYMLNGWAGSTGANRELEYAKKNEIFIMFERSNCK